MLQAQQAQAQAQMMQNLAAQQAQAQAQAQAPPQRRDDDESGALKLPTFKSSTIANGAEAFGHLVGAGTDIAK